ncbi:MAG: hypothetical protein V1856_02635 [Candidatus Liptonbacteria bacterium]
MFRKVFSSEKLWRNLTNFWMYFFMLFLVTDFFSRGSYDYLIAPFSAIYISVLSIYVGTKEFDRWYDYYAGKHPGEISVLVWTVLMVFLFLVSAFSKTGYRLSSEVVAVYIMVMSVFVLTQKSKALYFAKHKNAQKKITRK